MYEAAAKMKALGAELVNIPDSFGNNQLFGFGENIVLNYEFKQTLKSYLCELTNTKIKSVEGKYNICYAFDFVISNFVFLDLIAFNKKDPRELVSIFDNRNLADSANTANLRDSMYLNALKHDKAVYETTGLKFLMEKFNLDVMIGSFNGGYLNTMAAMAGAPSITVPAGFTNRYYDSTAMYNFKELPSRLQPVGIMFVGLPYTEPKLIKYAYAFEQATHHRGLPTFSKVVGTLV